MLHACHCHTHFHYESSAAWGANHHTGNSRMNSSSQREGTRFIKTICRNIFSCYLCILEDDTFEWAIVSGLHHTFQWNESFCGWGSLSKSCEQLANAKFALKLALSLENRASALLPSLWFAALVSSLELGDFNLSKLFTSMPPRLLLVCHEGADR